MGEVLEKRGDLRLQKEGVGSILCYLMTGALMRTVASRQLRTFRVTSSLISPLPFMKELKVANSLKKHKPATGSNSKHH